MAAIFRESSFSFGQVLISTQSSYSKVRWYLLEKGLFEWEKIEFGYWIKKRMVPSHYKLLRAVVVELEHWWFLLTVYFFLSWDLKLRVAA